MIPSQNSAAECAAKNGLVFYDTRVVDMQTLLASMRNGVLVVGEAKSRTFTAALRDLLREVLGYGVAVMPTFWDIEQRVDATSAEQMEQAIRGTTIDTVWFQCPWISKTGTAGLVERYLNAAARVGQIRNILLGTTTIQYWRQHYKLEEAVTNFSRAQHQFTLQGKDIDTTVELYRRGYRHTSASEKPICVKTKLALCPEAESIEYNTEVLWFQRTEVSGAPLAPEMLALVEAFAASVHL
eukprot:m51a1_g6546 hypothetical protein (240) ;mRNA; r:73970-74807